MARTKKTEEKTEKTRTRKTTTPKAKKTMAPEAIAPEATEEPTTPDVITTADDDVGDGTSQVAEDTSSVKVCACTRFDGGSCGRPAPSFGDINEECFIEYQQERGKVRCINYVTCFRWTDPFFKDGAVAPTYCWRCRKEFKSGSKVADSPRAAQELEERAETARGFCYSLLSALAEKFSEIDFGNAEKLRDEANVSYARGEWEEASTSFQSSVNVANRSVGDHCAGIEIPELASEIKAFIKAQVGAELVFSDLLELAERDSDPGDIALISRHATPKDFSLDTQRRVELLKDILAEAKVRADRFAPPPATSIPRFSKKLRRRFDERRRAEVLGGLGDDKD